jgi:hypothetical protein
MRGDNQVAPVQARAATRANDHFCITMSGRVTRLRWECSLPETQHLSSAGVGRCCVDRAAPWFSPDPQWGFPPMCSQSQRASVNWQLTREGTMHEKLEGTMHEKGRCLST